MGEGDSPELSCASHYALNRVLSPGRQSTYLPMTGTREDQNGGRRCWKQAGRETLRRTNSSHSSAIRRTIRTRLSLLTRSSREVTRPTTLHLEDNYLEIRKP